MFNDFEKFAISNGISSNKLHGYQQYANGLVSPSIVEERQLNAVTIDVFSALIRDRMIYLNTHIDSDVASIINAQMMYLNSVDDSSDIKLFISSGGGSVIDGLSIYDIMNWINCDVSTYVMGMAASMASVLCSSGEKGKRYALPNSTIMIHQVSSGAYGQNSDIQIAAKESQKWQNLLYDILAQNTGKTFEEIERDADRDHWFMAQEALEYGLIDEIITKKR